MTDTGSKASQVNTAQSAVDSGIRYLSRREHSQAELRRKLANKGLNAQHIDEALERLVELGYQSDQRFGQMIIRNRVNALYGPRKVQFELQGHQLSEGMISDCTAQVNPDWFAAAERFACKKTAGKPLLDYRQRAKLNKQLYARGFSSEQIRHAERSLAANE